jgi:hypothetical protein
MFDFISQSPPETTLLLGLATGALLSKTIKRVAQEVVKNRVGSGDDG